MGMDARTMENKARWLIVVACGLMFCACGRDASRGAGSVLEDAPEQIIERFTMVDRAGGRVTWELQARKAKIFEQRNEVDLETPTVRFHDEQSTGTVIAAQYGTYRRETQLVELWGAVVVDSLAQKTTVRTERLYYEVDARRIYSKVPVEITRPGSVTTGDGFESDVGLKKIRVFGNRTVVDEAYDTQNR